MNRDAAVANSCRGVAESADICNSQLRESARGQSGSAGCRPSRRGSAMLSRVVADALESACEALANPLTRIPVSVDNVLVYLWNLMGIQKPCDKFIRGKITRTL